MSLKRLAAMIALTAMMTGCHSFGIFAKRESEANCPTDIRKTVPWCAGEDAIFVCPCGPSGNFYGHRPTCWRDWPTTGPAWRDMWCGPTIMVQSSEPNPFRGPQPTQTPLPPPTELPTPEANPAPGSGPFGLPPLPESPAPAGDSVEPQKVGPPVLPPAATKTPPQASRSARPAGAASKESIPSEPISEASSTLAADDSAAPVAAAIDASAEWISPASSPRQPESLSLNDEAKSRSESNPVSTVEYVEIEAKPAAEVETASRAEEIDVANHQAGEIAPSGVGRPKFVRPNVGFGFVR